MSIKFKIIGLLFLWSIALTAQDYRTVISGEGTPTLSGVGINHIYIDELDGCEYIYNGTTWVKSNSSSNGGSIINVADFGATGDGATDDIDSIMVAINSMNHYDKLAFENGKTYKITSAIDIDSLQGICLLGNGATIIRADGSETNTTLSAQYTSGSTTLTVASVPSNWKIGDVIVLS